MKTLSAYYLRTITYLTVLLSCSLHSQSIWTAGLSSKEISVEYFQPSIKKILFLDISGYSFQLVGRYSINDTKCLIIQIPYLTGKNTYQSYTISGFSLQPITVTERKNTIGNIYVGMESHPEGAHHSINFGAYLPTISESKTLAAVPALFGNPDEYESYNPYFLTLNFRLNNTIAADEKLGLITRVGISGLIRTKKENGLDDFEAMLSYALQPVITIENFSSLIGFSGKMIVTESGPLKDRILHQLGFSASYKVDPLRIGAYYRVPLNKVLSDVVNNTFGFTVTFMI